MATFSATLSPPSGVTVSTVMQGRSGASYTPAGGQVTVTDERDLQALVDQGWAVVSVTRG